MTSPTPLSTPSASSVGDGPWSAGPAGSVVVETDLLGPLSVPVPAGGVVDMQALSARAAFYATRARGAGTRRVYRSAWETYCAWCAAAGFVCLPTTPEVLSLYLAARADAGLAVSTLRVDVAAIRTAHLLAGLPLDLRDPSFVMVMEGIVRMRGVRPKRQAAPAVADVVAHMVECCLPDSTALGARDRAMLLVGFGAALRRSELVALRLCDVKFVARRGLRVLVRRSKTDQQARGEEVAVWATSSDPSRCALEAVRVWLCHRDAAVDLAGPAHEVQRPDRPLFCSVTKSGRLTGEPLSDKAVVRLVKSAAARAGFDPRSFSGHSLRAGLATQAADAGAALPDLMRQTRHRSTQVALGYLRPADLWRNNVTEGIFDAQAAGGGLAPKAEGDQAACDEGAVCRQPRS